MDTNVNINNSELGRKILSDKYNSIIFDSKKDLEIYRDTKVLRDAKSDRFEQLILFYPNGFFFKYLLAV